METHKDLNVWKDSLELIYVCYRARVKCTVPLSPCLP